MTNYSTEPAPQTTGHLDHERLRNKLLRRVDWRFLLPQPSPALTVCFGAGELLEAVTWMSGQVLEPDVHLRDRCDLAVAINPDTATLRSAFVHLRAGGACYVEFTGRWPTRNGVQRRMAAAGFHHVRTYRPWPSVERCHAWLPLEPSWLADAYFSLQTDRRSGTLAGAARRARRRLSRLRLERGATRRISAVGVKAGADEHSAWADGVIQTGGQRSISKIVALSFDRDRMPPTAALKIARVPEAVPALEAEAETLEALHRMPGLPAGVPRLLFRRTDGHVYAVCETALTGQPIPPIRTDDAYRTVGSIATRWLAQLAHVSLQPATLWPEVAESALCDLESGYGPAVAPSLSALIRSRFTDIGALPSVCEHRDFSPWNVFLATGGAVTVYDWESAVLKGVPGLDLIYFLSYLSAPGGLNVDVYRRAWDESTAAGAINHQCCETYAKEIGIPSSAFRTLRLLTWIVHARSEHRRLVEDCGGAPSMAQLRGAVFLRLVEHEAGAETET